MSKYTTELRYILESLTDLQGGYSNVENIIANGIPKLFDFDFPIFDESYRNVLLTKICKHYYTQEIGAETVGLWKLRLDTKLNEIMPYYNQLYKSELLTYNPLYNVDVTIHRNSKQNDTSTEKNKNNYTETNDGTNTETQTENGNTTLNGILTNENTSNSTNAFSSNVKDMYSDTPQGTISNVENNTYLTNARITDTTNNASNTYAEKTSSTSNNTSEDERTINKKTGSEYNKNGNSNTDKNGTFNSTEEYLESIQGKNSGTSFSSLINEYRETFLNIDMMIIDELNTLFIQLW